MIHALTVLLSLLGVAAPEPAAGAAGHVAFGHPDGAYTTEMARGDFGGGSIPPSRGFARIVDGALEVTHVAGRKVNETGLSLNVRLPPRPRYTVEFRVRYSDAFEAGLHGKQIGLSGGKGYTGGRGEEARDKGDGWSARLQFDSHDAGVTNQLYVYHARMTGVYGEHLGTASRRFEMQRGRWHTLRMRVTMQTDAATPDGRIEVWQDGDLRFDVDGIQWVTREAGRVVDTLRIEVFAGGGGKTPERDNTVQFDDVRWWDDDAGPPATR